jgi:hypothetical protein
MDLCPVMDIISCGVAAFSEGRCGGFADAMSRAMRKVRLSAPVLELVAEAVRGERLAELGDKERL